MEASFLDYTGDAQADFPRSMRVIWNISRYVRVANLKIDTESVTEAFRVH